VGSGVLNATQQLASAIGVAAIGTVFFSTLNRSGFTAAIRQCLMIELGVAAVLFVLARALPRRPRDAQTAGAEPAATTATSHPSEPESVSAARYAPAHAQVTASGQAATASLERIAAGRAG
jgi:hypothetical protein